MNVAIFVHSRTGNTRSVAVRIRQTLESSGHTARIIDVGTAGGAGGEPGVTTADGVEALNGCEGVIFGSPVHGFSPAPDIDAFIRTIPSLKGRAVACFVTQAFPFPWMGGSRSVRQMAKLCTALGATVSATSVVNWGRTCREKLIDRTVERVASVFR